MPYLEPFMSSHNQDAGLKGNRLMVQRKGNLPVKDGRSSEERDQEDLDIMAAVSKVRVPTPPLPQPWGVFLLTQLRELGKMSLNWYHQFEPIREPN